MTTITPDTVDPLHEKLRDLAVLTAKIGFVTRQELEQIAADSGSSDVSSTADRLETWAAILLPLVADNSNASRDVARTQLLALGIPEAPAILAIDEVASLTGIPAPNAGLSAPLPISVTPHRLGFGALPPGSSSTLRLTVGGGPGSISTSSAMLTVTPDQFGPTDTYVTVAVAGGVAGQIVQATISLKTSVELVEVDVTAMWAANTPAFTGTGGASPNIPASAIGQILRSVPSRFLAWLGSTRIGRRICLRFAALSLVAPQIWAFVRLPAQVALKAIAGFARSKRRIAILAAMTAIVPIAFVSRSYYVNSNLSKKSSPIPNRPVSSEARDINNGIVTRLIAIQRDYTANKLTETQLAHAYSDVQAEAKRAVSLSEAAVKADPYNEDAWQQNVRAVYYLGDYQKANQLITEAIQRFPDNTDLQPLEARIQSKLASHSSKVRIDP